ncbi:MAG: type II toxin-antitoxin system VapC family toxin [Sphingomonadaceae bacterium]|nr:type II toxin-antitoxin system VapC family toxin [Sphingomonadaceae bacterium]
MLLLLDTHILLALVDEELEPLPPHIDETLRDPHHSLFASAVSLWEIAIKHRLGKLPLPCPLEEWPEVLSTMAVTVMDIRPPHVLAEADPLPETKDPFDRLLLAICECEDMRLVTLDKMLLRHPLAWHWGSA